MDREWLSSQKTVKTAAIIFIAFATVFLFVLTIGTVRSWNESDAATGERPQITVLGTGEVTKVPDIAEFTFTVQEEGKTTKEAQDKATAKANAAIAYHVLLVSHVFQVIKYLLDTKYLKVFR